MAGECVCCGAAPRLPRTIIDLAVQDLPLNLRGAVLRSHRNQFKRFAQPNRGGAQRRCTSYWRTNLSRTS